MTRLSSALAPIMFLLFLCRAVCAQTLVIDSSRTWSEVELHKRTVNVVDGANPPTVLDIMFTPDFPYAAMATIRTYDSSVVNSSAPLSGSRLRAYDSSTVNLSISGATGGTLFGNDFATINIFDGQFVREDFLEARGSSTLNFFGGSVYHVYSHDSATVNVFDGDVDRLQAQGASTVNIYGGYVGDRAGSGLRALYSSTMHIFGTEFNYPPGPIPDTFAVLTGTLADGSGINTNFYIGSNDASIILHYVPEPSSLCLGMMGALAGLLAYTLRRRKEAA